MHNSIEPSNCIQHLRTLPTEVVPPYNWQEFRRRSAVATTSRAITNWRPLAVAAALLLFVCAIAVWGRFGDGGRHVVVESSALEDNVPARSQGAGPTIEADRWRRTAGPAAGIDRWSSDAVPAADDDRWLAGAASTNDAGQIAGDSNIAVKRSRAIESWLASLPREPAVVRVGTRAAVATLEDRIAQVDDLMTSMRISGTPSDRVAALQRERLRLVGSLAQVRYAEVVASTSP
ncbi:MAG: hypothetical protein JSR66_11590 [Proteobacteria bacterium]|nr:hypothetical protein [Pseudomonadota bacterium]